MTTYYERNKEKIKIKQDLYIKNNKEKVLKQKREWARKHRVELRAKGLMPPTKKELIESIDKAKNINQYIIDYGFDYDGLNTIESLKGLIDMLVDYAKQVKEILGDKENVKN